MEVLSLDVTTKCEGETGDTGKSFQDMTTVDPVDTVGMVSSWSSIGPCRMVVNIRPAT